MMMWSNFFVHEEDRRLGAAGRRRARGARKARLAPEHDGKIKLALLLTSVGATLAVLAVGTEFWVELNTYRDNGSAVCDAAHLGLWKMCTKRLWQADVPAGRDTCGPAELPGEANCTYFKFFTTGEDAHIFQRTTKKEVNLAAAVIAVLGLAVMALGCLCIIMALSKGAEFLLRVGAICFGLSETRPREDIVRKQSSASQKVSSHKKPTYQHLDLGFLASRIMGNKFLLFKLPFGYCE
nr:voltage-dependent calcium channel gamma-6 subunit isoform X1 [Kogia breviceps]